MQYDVRKVRYYMVISLSTETGSGPLEEYELWEKPPVVPAVGSHLFVGKNPAEAKHVSVTSVQHEFRMVENDHLMQLISIQCVPFSPPRRSTNT
jgi:hypothetical protein